MQASKKKCHFWKLAQKSEDEYSLIHFIGQNWVTWHFLSLHWEKSWDYLQVTQGHPCRQRCQPSPGPLEWVGKSWAAKPCSVRDKKGGIYVGEATNSRGYVKWLKQTRAIRASSSFKRHGKKIASQFSWVTQSCVTLCDPMDRSMPGLPVHHQLQEFTQTHVHWVGDAI